MFKIGPKMTKIDPKLTPKCWKSGKLTQTYPKSVTVTAKFLLMAKTMGLPLKILLLVPKPTWKLLPSFQSKIILSIFLIFPWNEDCRVKIAFECALTRSEKSFLWKKMRVQQNTKLHDFLKAACKIMTHLLAD